MTLVRGDERLELERRWVDLLSERGAIDPYAQPPDLARWRRRALRRAGLESPEQDQRAFQEHYEALTARDRAVASPWGLALFKLSSPEGWIVGEQELKTIVEALHNEPSAEALVAFARGGSFEVR